jgi:hypothetical protein
MWCIFSDRLTRESKQRKGVHFNDVEDEEASKGARKESVSQTDARDEWCEGRDESPPPPSPPQADYEGELVSGREGAMSMSSH